MQNFRQILDGLSEEARRDTRVILATNGLKEVTTRWPLPPDSLPDPALYVDTIVPPSDSVLLDAAQSDPDCAADEPVMTELRVAARRACRALVDPASMGDGAMVEPSQSVVEFMALSSAKMLNAMLDKLISLEPEQSESNKIRSTFSAATVFNAAETLAPLEKMPALFGESELESNRRTFLKLKTIEQARQRHELIFANAVVAATDADDSATTDAA